MGRTLLIGNPKCSWKEWLKAERGDADWICLDPAEVVSNYLARLTLTQADRTTFWRFYGSLDPQRYPHVLLAGLVGLLHQASDDAVIQLFRYQPNPILKHTAQLIAQIVQPRRILVAKGTEISLEGWPTGPEEIELGQPLPEIAISAQRKASWLKLIENCETHEIPFGQVSFEGVRIGSGFRLERSLMERARFPEGMYAEVCGSTLFMISDEELDEGLVASALDDLHCARVQYASPSAYERLLCSFAKQDGEDFGLGYIEKIDFANETIYAKSTAIPVAPVRILRLGALKIDAKGNEIGEARPWQV